jgi:hypothetical protein
MPWKLCKNLYDLIFQSINFRTQCEKGAAQIEQGKKIDSTKIKKFRIGELNPGHLGESEVS